MILKRLFLLTGLALALFACRKETIISGTGVNLRFSTDTVYLDTVFTQIGSSTYTLKVYNDAEETVEIDNIRLGKPSSSFNINVNGKAVTSIENVQILPNDSMYIFVEVNAPNAASAEYLLTDSIIFNNKDKEQFVQLVSLAREAKFIRPNRFLTSGSGDNLITIPYSIIPCDTSWSAGLPIVVYGYAVIDEGCELAINPGVDVHFHNNSGLWVFNGGTLKVAEGNNPGGDSVTFQGDRLEPYYEDIPGQWGGVLGGIFIDDSARAIINTAVIKNATTAIRLDSGQFNDQLNITNSYILNNSRVGLYGGYGKVNATNVVIANAGVHLFYAFGGNYQFRHTTFANYWNQSTRQDPSVYLTNFIEVQTENGIEVVAREIEQCYFGNCIIDGINRQEFVISEDESRPLSYRFTNALLKLNNDIEDRGFDVSDADHFTQNTIYVNTASEFVNVEVNNYALDTASQAVNVGNTSDATQALDILGNFRNIGGLPDLGAIERQF